MRKNHAGQDWRKNIPERTAKELRPELAWCVEETENHQSGCSNASKGIVEQAKGEKEAEQIMDRREQECQPQGIELISEPIRDLSHVT